MSKSNLYVGTYQYEDPFTEQVANGVYHYIFDSDSGGLTLVGRVDEVNNPSFLAMGAGRQYLFAVDEAGSFEQSRLCVYQIEKGTGALALINGWPSHGISPCFVDVDASGKFAAVANYGSGTVALFPVGRDGRLAEASAVHAHDGSSINRDRQAGPHAHCALFDPTNRYLFVVDLGIDKVVCYRVDAMQGTLSLNDTPFLEVPAGSGPRHLTFHGNGRFAYLINELTSTVMTLAYDADHGKLTIIQTISTLPADFDGTSHCAELKVSEDGRFLYASNRGHDSIAVFEIDQADGLLVAVGYQSTFGKNPRHFTLDVSGRFLLVANQDSRNIVLFRVDLTTGLLTFVLEEAVEAKPVCLVTG